MVAQLKPVPAGSNAAYSPDKEYVAASGLFSARIGQVLSSLFLDDAELAAGADVYERMLTDPEVKKGHKVIKDGVLGDGVQFYPAVSDEADPQQQFARDMCDALTHSLGQLRRPFRETLDEAVGDALAFGHKVAEITYKDFTDEQGRPLLVHDSIKVKPRNATQFVVDPYWNVLGLQVWQYVPGTAASMTIIPREKFFIPTFNRKDEDPRGRSILRAAYNWWLAKRAGLPIYLKRIEKKANPSLVGTTSEAEDQPQPETDEHGTPIAGGKLLTPSEVMARKLAELEDGSAAAFPFGAQVKVIDSSGNGTELKAFFEVCDSQITMSILLQTLATRDSKNGSRAQSRTHMDVMSLLIWHIKGIVADCIREDIVKPWVYYNYGPEGLSLMPVVSLGDSERRDWALDAQAAAAIAANLTDSQWLTICKQLGIPNPVEGETLPSRAKSAPAAPQPPTEGGAST
jgi:hypothetical protein